MANSRDIILEAITDEVVEYLLDTLELGEDDFELSLDLSDTNDRCKVYVNIADDKAVKAHLIHDREKNCLTEALSENIPGVYTLVMLDVPRASAFANLDSLASLDTISLDPEDDLAVTDEEEQYREEGLSISELDEDYELRDIDNYEGDEYEDDYSDFGSEDGEAFEGEEYDEYIPDEEDKKSFDGEDYGQY